MLNRCEECQHKEICKYRSSYEATLQLFMKDKAFKVPEPFTVHLNCTHFYTSYTTTYGSTDGAYSTASTYSNTRSVVY